MTRRILVADDDPLIRGIIARSLSALADCEVVSAEDGGRASALAREAPPDLVLLDLSMPGRDGWALLKELRGAAATRLVQVIVVSGQGSEESRVGGLAQGADDFIVKPFLPAELAARVVRLLERRRQDLSANPLTRLPGNPAIEEDVQRRLRAGLPFAFCHADIDRFKVFNDRYGFARGDQLIAAAAALLVECAREAGDDLFVGHVGGDDFTLAGPPLETRAAAALIVERFDARAAEFYDAEDRERGWIRVKDRRGPVRRVRLASISIGGATTEVRPLSRYAEAAAIASEMKAFLKSGRRVGGSRLAFDRRRA